MDLKETKVGGLQEQHMDLTIRKMKENDLEALHELLSDPAVMEYLEAPFAREKTKQFLSDAGLADPPLIYAVAMDDAFVGYVIFHDYDAESMEIGWVLHPSCWGKGYASRLTELLMEKGRDMGKDLVIECVPEQDATKHIARKYGFDYEGRIDGLDVFRRKIQEKQI